MWISRNVSLNLTSMRHSWSVTKAIETTSCALQNTQVWAWSPSHHYTLHRLLCCTQATRLLLPMPWTATMNFHQSSLTSFAAAQTSTRAWLYLLSLGIAKLSLLVWNLLFQGPLFDALFLGKPGCYKSAEKYIQSQKVGIFSSLSQLTKFAAGVSVALLIIKTKTFSFIKSDSFSVFKRDII